MVFGVLSFSQRGAVKAKSAVESARERQTRLMATQKAENKSLGDFNEWSPAADSRPSSGMFETDLIFKKKKKKTCGYLCKAPFTLAIF